MTIQSQEYFARQITIPDFGTKGLGKLRSSTVAIAGVGGVGSAAAYYLSKSGVGNLRLIDQDIVEATNMHRLHATEMEDLYKPKAEVLTKSLSRLHPWCRIEPVVETITGKNVGQLLEGADLVLDGLDNFRTRYVVNRFSSRTRTPYLFVSAVSDQAHVALFNPPDTPCLECVMPGIHDRPEDSCEVLGITPTITGLVGATAANMAVRHLLRLSTEPATKLLTIDMNGPTFLLTKISERADCSACNGSSKIAPEAHEIVTLLCGERTANVLPPFEIDLDLHKISQRIPKEDILIITNSVVVFRKDAFTVSLFQNGRTLISGVEGEEEALEMAREIWEEVLGKELMLS